MGVNYKKMEYFKLTKLNDADSDINKRWFAFYSYINPETNRLQRFRIFISNQLLTKTARYKKFHEIKAEYDQKLLRGWNPFEAENPNLMTCTRAIDLFKSVKARTLRKRSISAYSSFINHFNKWLKKENLLNLPVSQFSFHHAQKLMDYILTSSTINNCTYNNYLRAYKTIFNFFEYRELLVKNPFFKCQTLREDEGKIVAFSSKEWEIIQKHLKEYDKRLWLAAMFIYYAALRPAEIIKLRFADIDLERQKICSMSANSKNKKQQIIELVDQLQLILKEENWDYPEDYYLFSKNLLPGPKLNFPTRIAGRWRKFANKYEIKERHIYDLKHNVAGRLIDAGFNSRDIQFHLRHHSLDQTEKYLSKFRNTSGERMKHSYPNFG
jgi:integrase